MVPARNSPGTGTNLSGLYLSLFLASKLILFDKEHLVFTVIRLKKNKENMVFTMIRLKKLRPNIFVSYGRTFWEVTPKHFRKLRPNILGSYAQTFS